MKRIQRTAILFAGIIIFSLLSLGGSSSRGIGYIALKSRKGKLHSLKAYDNIYGLVIGIDKFSGLSRNKQLKYCVKDARGVRDVLKSQYRFRRIDELYNRDATKQGIMAQFHRMKRQIGKNDALFVFIATHGMSEDDIGYIVPHDGSFTETYKNISMVELRDVVGKFIKAKHIFYVVDACYSGSILKTRAGSAKNDASFEYIREKTKESVRYALTAGDKGQEVLDGGPGGHSVFAGRFIEALKNTDGFITGSELSTKISRKVFSDARDRRHKQTPQHGRLSGLGDFVLIKKGGKRLDGVNADLKRIQLEKKKLESQFRNARNKQARELVRLALQRKRAEEKRKKLEQDQLKLGEQRKAADRIRAARLQKDYLANRKRQQAQLERVKRQVAAKRKQMDALGGGVNTSNGFLLKLRTLKKVISGVRRSFDGTRKREVYKASSYYRKRHRSVARMKRGMFELSKEFIRRKKIETDTLRQNEDNEKRKINTRFAVEKKKALTGLLKQLQSLTRKNIFTVPVGKIKLNFAAFDPNRSAFPITVSCRIPRFRFYKRYYHKITADNSTDRRLKGMKIFNKIKAKAYAPVLKYWLDLKTKRRKFHSLTIIDITANGRVLFKEFPAKRDFNQAEKVEGSPLTRMKVWKKYLRQYGSGSYGERAKKQLSYWNKKHQVLLKAAAQAFQQARQTRGKPLVRLKVWKEFLKEYGSSRFKWKARKQHAYWNKKYKIWLKNPASQGMVFVKGGTFKMGDVLGGGDSDEKPVHRVYVSSFWMGKYEVTQKEYQRVMGTSPSKFTGDTLPVEKVSWYDAVKYCNKRSEMEGLTPCYVIAGENTTCNFKANGYRLPTEAEWEFAAKGGAAGASSPFKYAGDNSSGAVGWYKGNSGNETHPVGQKLGNQLGLYDMSGNVWEWCWDWYGKKYYSQSPRNNPRGPGSGSDRVPRGGSYNLSANSLQVGYRYGSSPYYEHNSYGFRLSRTP